MRGLNLKTLNHNRQSHDHHSQDQDLAFVIEIDQPQAGYVARVMIYRQPYQCQTAMIRRCGRPDVRHWHRAPMLANAMLHQKL